MREDACYIYERSCTADEEGCTYRNDLFVSISTALVA